jgi:two-component system, NtrC family, sensor kinase
VPGLGRLEPPSRRSFRVRLLLLALLPLGVVLPLLVAVLAIWGGEYFDRLLITKVQSDLAVAHGYFGRVADGVGGSVEGLAGSARLLRSLNLSSQQRGQAVDALLADVRTGQRLDFLQFFDVDRSKQAAPGWAVVRAALAGQALTETGVFSAEQLRQINPLLAERAVTPLIDTANALPDQRQIEERGLVLHAAAPVHDENGVLLGVLAGGVLLNKNLAFVDRLNEIVYPDGALPFGSAGTATFFLGDVRVATNVRLFAGGRAIGTRVSSVVHTAVLDEGRTWLDRAFVVRDWYISAYEPLYDSSQQRIGMLYVGFLDGPFALARHNAIAIIVGLFTLAMVGAAFFAVLSARRVFKPIERMHSTMHAIEQGNADARVGPVQSRDELGVVAAHFDQLLDRLQAQAISLTRWGESLDTKVAERTSELERALADRRAAQSQLVMSEKMAAIGQLTAGVAHEINNPVAVIQGNLDVLCDILGPATEPVAPEVRLMREQVHRIRLIITKLLQFARPQDFVGYLEPVAPTQLIQDSLVLVGHLLKKGNIVIEQYFDSNRHVLCNRNELQQVLINLMVNAIQAMPEGGVLTLGAEDWDETDMPVGLRLVVADSGPGISDEDSERLFKPFFTSNKPGGTGLGLWVSQSLVERYGGRITVDSRPGQGTRFVVWLRFEPLT